MTQDDESGSVLSMMTNQTLPAYDPQFLQGLLSAAGLKPLHPVWAKLEILLGLAVACLGALLIRDRAIHDALAAALMILGLYLAAAGHRSHLYQSQNRQTAYLLQVLATLQRERQSPGCPSGAPSEST